MNFMNKSSSRISPLLSKFGQKVKSSIFLVHLRTQYGEKRKYTVVLFLGIPKNEELKIFRPKIVSNEKRLLERTSG